MGRNTEKGFAHIRVNKASGMVMEIIMERLQKEDRYFDAKVKVSEVVDHRRYWSIDVKVIAKDMEYFMKKISFGNESR